MRMGGICHFFSFVSSNEILPLKINNAQRLTSTKTEQMTYLERTFVDK